jgi:hypothetical protein
LSSGLILVTDLILSSCAEALRDKNIRSKEMIALMSFSKNI